MPTPKDLSPNLTIFEKIAHAKTETQPPRIDVTRRAGFVIGALAGLSLALASWALRSASLPGVPLAPGTTGMLMRALVCILFCTLLGGLVAWPRSVAPALLFGDSAILVLGLGWYISQGPQAVSLVVTITPSMFFLMAVVGVASLGTPCVVLLRAAAEAQGDRWYRPLWDWSRVRLPLLALVMAAVFGALTMPTARARTVMTRMDQMVQQARSGDIARPFAQTSDVTAHARYPYTVEISPDPVIRNELSSNLAPLDQLVLAKFTDGWTLACLFKDGIDMVICRGY